MTKKIRHLYSAHDFPIFQNRMYDTEKEALSCPRGDIELVEDLDSGLVYNAAFDASLMDYDTAYQNEQGNSNAFRAHLEQVADLIQDEMGYESLIEVGCGKGGFLDLLANRGATVTGFDPTFEGADSRIRKEYFNPSIGMSADGLILRHVLEHIQDPVGFLMLLAEANGGRGKIYIEVPCLDWICENRAWFDIFYEHVNYFRLGDFEKIFGEPVAAGRCFGGQYLFVVGDLSRIQRPVYDARASVPFPSDFMASLDTSEPTDRDVVWGGASKGVIYTLLRARAGNPVAGIIDINPAKQGKFLAASGLRVGSPKEVLPTLSPETRIMIMNPNYTQEIKAMSGSKFQYIEVGR